MTEHADGHVESTLAMDISEARLLKRSLGRIGHDLSNLLTPLTAYPDLIRMELPEEGKSRELLEVMVDTTSDLVRMARRMQDLSLCDDFHGQPLSLNDLVAATVSEFSETTPGAVNVTTSLCPEDVRVIGGHDKLGGLVVHLLQNAVDAMGGFGEVSVTTRCAALEESKQVATGTVAPGSCVELIFEDSGSGLQGEGLTAAFEPFFTTKRDSAKRGAGLGLTYCLLVARAHGGLLDLVTSSTEGTRVTVYLPTADNQRDLCAMGCGDGGPSIRDAE
jgi:signal transduction histidine kinase